MRSCKRGWGGLEIWVLHLLLTGLTDTSGEESSDILERYTDSPVSKSSIGNSQVVSDLISSS